MKAILRQFSVVAGFALLLLLLLGNAVITRRQLNTLIGNEAWVAHTRQVLLEVERTQSLLLNAETGQRGYLFTGDRRYLAPYSQAVSQIDAQIDAIARLTSDNPAERANIERLRILSHQKLDELAETISLYRAGHADQARHLVLTDEGLLLMQQIRQVVADMQSEETRLEAQRTVSYQRSITITGAAILAATAVAMLGLIALAWYILKERTIRDRHAQEIRAREEWFRVTLTSIGDAVIATDREGKVTFFNPVAEALTGIPAAQAVGKDVLAVFPIFNEFTGQPAENPVSKVIDLGTVIGLANHTAVKHAEGRLTPIEDSAAPIRDDRKQLIGVVLVFRDVSAERKSQELARRSEKLATAARLSATVAHEINNPLEAVVNLIFLARTDPTTPPAVVERLILADQEIERVAHITRQTLGFYRESKAPEQIQINDLIASVLNIYSSRFAANSIRVDRNFCDCPPILGVAGELRQVFSNVIANAIDAAAPEGQISISTQYVPSPENGGNIEVVVADSGPGIAAEDLDRIFEPFFTTKKDVGTGLGLWVTKEIVERHGGVIHVEPAHDLDGIAGAAFTLEIPCRPHYGADEAAGKARPATKSN